MTQARIRVLDTSLSVSERIEEVELAGPVERLHSSLVGGVKHLPIRYKLKAL